MVNIKQIVAKWWAKRVHRQTLQWSKNAAQIQENTLFSLIRAAKETQFGKDHQFESIQSYADFQKNVPVRDYEGLRSYIELIKKGQNDVLWPGKPLYFAKTSGTTSGAKYIPITKDSIGNHINSAKNAILQYIHNSGNASFLTGKLIFLSGSPVLEKIAGINTGRLSGISNHHVPGYLRTNQLPSYETNCIEDWEDKVNKIAQETIQENMTLISGIPPWVQMYFDVLEQKTGKKAGSLFPNFQLFIYGGVNFEPYRSKLEESIGRSVDTIELFPASEGFFAYQDQLKNEGLLLLCNENIFFEFIPLEEMGASNPKRLMLSNVEIGKNYALIINSNAGLWGYNIGDTVKFVSLSPYRIIVSGRVKHFISAFGEHVIGEEVEFALKEALLGSNVILTEFHVAPMVSPESGLPYHEWFIEANGDADWTSISEKIDVALQQKNIYYKDLRDGNILKQAVITLLKPDSFIEYMDSQGKLGGQNKVPRLANDRNIADWMHQNNRV
jgi:hypothetical protein